MRVAALSVLQAFGDGLRVRRVIVEQYCPRDMVQLLVCLKLVHRMRSTSVCLAFLHAEPHLGHDFWR